LLLFAATATDATAYYCLLLPLLLLLLLLLLQELNVTEHVDPSLFVIEPCCGVAGLEVLDAHTQQWLQAEAVCAAGKDLILFGGKALEVRTSNYILLTYYQDYSFIQ
jgi:hypothetical protein